jgi:hypothetical protein
MVKAFSQMSTVNIRLLLVRYPSPLRGPLTISGPLTLFSWCPDNRASTILLSSTAYGKNDFGLVNNLDKADLGRDNKHLHEHYILGLPGCTDLGTNMCSVHYANLAETKSKKNILT